MKVFISKDLEKECLLISKKMKNFINVVDIINWLNNFEEEDRDDMLELLKRFRFFNDSEIIEGYKKLITDITYDINENFTIFVHPIGQYGKSGTAMVYYFKKALQAAAIDGKLKKCFSYISNIEMLEKYNNINISKCRLILLDDFLGSGKSAKKYYNDISGNIKDIEKIYIMSFICMDKAEELISSFIPNVIIKYCELETKVFSTKHNTLGKREKIIRIREKVYKYSFNNNLGIKNKDYLGYDNSQCLVGFSFGTPNNTLPIFWNNNNDWFALFPRFASERISKIKQIRRELSFELSAAYTLGIDIFKDLNNIEDTALKIQIKKIDYSILAILKFKVERKSDITICRLLGITTEDYDSIINIAIERGTLDKSRELTELGKSSYNTIRDIVRNYRHNLKEYDLSSINIESLYVPSSFCGKS